MAKFQKHNMKARFRVIETWMSSPCAGGLIGRSGVDLGGPVPVVDEGEVEGEVVGDGDGPLDGALVGAHHDAVLPRRDVPLDPLAEEGLDLEKMKIFWIL